MITIEIPEREFWDEEKEQFVRVKNTTLTLEHSLVSISKWEQKWHIPFLTDKDKTIEQTNDYIRCMTLTQNVRPEIYQCITSYDIQRINSYIKDPMTATWFTEKENQKVGKEVVTSELIYYAMIAYNIPVEFQKWHINRLLTLINVCKIKNEPQKKKSAAETMRENIALNEARKKQFHTKG